MAACRTAGWAEMTGLSASSPPSSTSGWRRSGPVGRPAATANSRRPESSLSWKGGRPRPAEDVLAITLADIAKGRLCGHATDDVATYAMGWLERRAALVEPGTLTGYRNDILIRVMPRLRGRLRVAALFILCPPGRTVKSAAFVGSTGSSNMCPSGRKSV